MPHIKKYEYWWRISPKDTLYNLRADWQISKRFPRKKKKSERITLKKIALFYGIDLKLVIDTGFFYNNAQNRQINNPQPFGA